MNRKIILFLYCFIAAILSSTAQMLPEFKATGSFNEQELTINDSVNKILVNIVAPTQIKEKEKTIIVFFALPNGNSIEWTKGKKVQAGDDWHYGIQHIAAQMRYVRVTDKYNNYIIVYLMAAQKSWPAWKRGTPNSINIIRHTVDSIANLFKEYHPSIVLNGHSGGGSFIFGYLDAVNEIAANIERIAFLDSDYGYNDTLHQQKLINWLNKSERNKLLVLAYNDSIVIYNGKPLVSPTGGTWYRSRLMQRNLSRSFRVTTSEDTSFIMHKALNGRIQIILKQNPQGLIYHTEQVARNGFILSIFSGTSFDKKKFFTYFGDRAYEQYIGK